ncbi:MAG TPA: hypothetical protein QF533_05390 [Nitrospinota bacterium]|nr:hypothetical protein [Nitrospinota bacterium]MDP7369117.1 hypothetical protein [Nitrospinota bacterium]MDP7502838.1 hypothetical protein [Nitrospinota bacterium]MDP7664748.1 hypothetical protein [Nitrospinota bacterium]HJP13769.1 hypothetical protein [Nitrospinota bacterium]
MSEGDGTAEALALKEDFRSAGLSPEDLAMLEYAEKITLAPWTVTESDVENLRAHGFDDVAILEIATVSAYRNFIARVANGLGIELEDGKLADNPEARAAMMEGLV